MAPGTDPHKTYERGDDEAGLAVIRQWLNRAQVKTENLALHDGSGLSRLDLVTPEATARLCWPSRARAASIFYDSLPFAGVDGTLGGVSVSTRVDRSQDGNVGVRPRSIWVCRARPRRGFGLFGDV